MSSFVPNFVKSDISGYPLRPINFKTSYISLREIQPTLVNFSPGMTNLEGNNRKIIIIKKKSSLQINCSTVLTVKTTIQSFQANYWSASRMSPSLQGLEVLFGAVSSPESDVLHYNTVSGWRVEISQHLTRMSSSIYRGNHDYPEMFAHYI